MKIFKLYDKYLTSHPIPTKCLTSSILCGIGDIICQKYIDKPSTEQKNDNYKIMGVELKRLRTMLLAGALIVPPIHVWYNVLSKAQFIKNFSPVKQAFVMMCLDQSWFSFSLNSCILCFVSYMNNFYDTTRAYNDWRSKIVETMLTSWIIWPAAQMINFMYIPLQYRILWVNMINLGWFIVLSKLSNK